MTTLAGQMVAGCQICSITVWQKYCRLFLASPNF